MSEITGVISPREVKLHTPTT